ncbi:MAG: hypothetical protein QXT16_08580 [Candidatus Caldarchaeum sp.]
MSRIGVAVKQHLTKTGRMVVGTILIDSGVFNTTKQPLADALSRALTISEEQGILRKELVEDLVLKTDQVLEPVVKAYREDVRRIGRAWDRFASYVQSGQYEVVTVFSFLNYEPKEKSEKFLYARLTVSERPDVQEQTGPSIFWLPIRLPHHFDGLVSEEPEVEQEITKNMEAYVRHCAMQIFDNVFGFMSSHSGWELTVSLDPKLFHPVYLDDQSTIVFIPQDGGGGGIYFHADMSRNQATMLYGYRDAEQLILDVTGYISCQEILDAIPNLPPKPRLRPDFSLWPNGKTHHGDGNGKWA